MIGAKRIITRSESFSWIDKLAGKTIKEAYDILESAQAKYGSNAVLECEHHDYYATSCVEVTREETDEEYNSRIRKEEMMAASLLARERIEFERLSEKFATEENKPMPMGYDDWCKITKPVYEPLILSFGNEDVINNFLHRKYKEYVIQFNNGV
jgi:hypothetical protein